MREVEDRRVTFIRIGRDIYQRTYTGHNRYDDVWFSSEFDFPLALLPGEEVDQSELSDLEFDDIEDLDNL